MLTHRGDLIGWKLNCTIAFEVPCMKFSSEKNKISDGEKKLEQTRKENMNQMRLLIKLSFVETSPKQA